MDGAVPVPPAVGDDLDGAIGLEGGGVAAAPAAFDGGLVQGAALPAPFAVPFCSHFSADSFKDFGEQYL